MIHGSLWYTLYVTLLYTQFLLYNHTAKSHLKVTHFLNTCWAYLLAIYFVFCNISVGGRDVLFFKEFFYYYYNFFFNMPTLTSVPSGSQRSSELQSSCQCFWLRLVMRWSTVHKGKNSQDAFPGGFGIHFGKMFMMPKTRAGFSLADLPVASVRAALVFWVNLQTFPYLYPSNTSDCPRHTCVYSGNVLS